jgi:hypothetical protein
MSRPTAQRQARKSPLATHNSQLGKRREYSASDSRLMIGSGSGRRAIPMVRDGGPFRWQVTTFAFCSPWLYMSAPIILLTNKRTLNSVYPRCRIGDGNSATSGFQEPGKQRSGQWSTGVRPQCRAAPRTIIKILVAVRFIAVPAKGWRRIVTPFAVAESGCGIPRRYPSRLEFGAQSWLVEH